jgi:hypothetical protein
MSDGSESERLQGGDPSLALGALELDFLQAALDLSHHQAGLSDLLAIELGISPYEYWIRARADGQPPPAALKQRYRDYQQEVRSGDWEAFFHGFECDVQNVKDGRFVRIDFGPSARPLALSGFGVLQYVMCAREPWRPFPVLRGWLAESGPPYHPLSGSHAKMTEIAARLASAKLFEVADPVLWSRRSEFETFDARLGCTVLRVPASGTGPTASDLVLCGRGVLSPLAAQILAKAGRLDLETQG